MKRNLYKGPRSHRGNYLNIGMHKHHSRECHTHSRKQTYTHSIQLANRPDLWPCLEHYADKQVKSKARHNSHDEVPYEKSKCCSKLPRQLRDDILDLRGVHHFSRVVFWEVFVAHTSKSNRKTRHQTADIWQVQYENETTKQLTGNGRIT